MTLELKHLAPYLPYNLNGIATDGSNYELIGLNSECGVFKNNKYSKVEGQLKDFKPLLLLLSEFGDTRFIGTTDMLINAVKFKELPYKYYEMLFANHYDVFGLIDAGLALNKNEIIM